MSIWDDDGSKYGTYEGEPGSPEQWAAGFAQILEGSDAVKAILGESYCSILGVPVGASQEQIKRAYRTKIKSCCPDRHPERIGDFRRYTRAYEVLTGKHKPTIQPVATTATNRTQRRKRKAPDEDNQTSSSIIIPQLLTSIDEDDVQRYINDPTWGAQEKKDGRHITIEINNDNVITRNKKGQASSGSIDFGDSLKTLNRRFIIDGEHIGSKFYVWDLLEIDTVDLRPESYQTRFDILGTLQFDSSIEIVPLAVTKEEKQSLFDHLKSEGKEGIVFKKLDAPFSPGKGMDQLKFKFYADCSIIVAPGRQGRASIGMILINDNGQHEHVGYCTCTLHPLPLPGTVADVKYLYAYKGGCLYQSAFKGIRDDVDVNECTTSQLKYKSEE